MLSLGVTADLVDADDRIDRMSGQQGFGAFKSPHGAIGEHVPKATVSETHQLDLNSLTLQAKDDTGSRLSDRFSRGGALEPLSIWSKADADHGWDRASANHFASRPQSPQRSTLLVPGPASDAAPKTAPLPPYVAFNPVITPPTGSAVPLPQKSPSPPRPNSERDKEVVYQAGHHLQQLQSLIAPLVSQLEELEKLKAEITMWKKSCEAAAYEVNRLQTTVAAQTEAKPTVIDAPNFAAVLLDGDSLLFYDMHLKSGPQGGQAAAKALLQSIADLDGQTATSTQAQTTVQVFISKTSLGNGLIKAGLVSSWSVFDGFWHGFSAGHGLISVVDVGAVKDAVQDKLIEHAKLYSANGQCNKVIVGSNRSLPLDHLPADKITLIKSKASQSETNIITLPDIFRSEPLPVAPISFSSIVSSAPQTPRKPNPPTVEHDGTSQSEDLEVEVYDWEELPKDNIDEWTEARKKGNKKVATGNKSTPNGGKKAASTTASPATNGKKDKKMKRGGVKHRKDYGVRDMKPRPCHSYYLSPAGCRNDVCHYGHEYDLDDDQLNELAHLAKQIPCPFARNNRCHFDDETCIYGHKCPRGNSCTFDECRFDDIDPDHQDWS